MGMWYSTKLLENPINYKIYFKELEKNTDGQ